MKKLNLLLVVLALCAGVALPGASRAAMLPDTIGDWTKGEGAPGAVPHAKVWREYGLQDAETAPYEAAGRRYTISVWRFGDATGSYAAFEEIRPAGAKPVESSGLGVANATDELVSVGNYLFFFKGYKPNVDELNHLVGTAPKYSQSPRPILAKYLPGGMDANSERYVMGPESLAEFFPSVSPSTAAFHFSAEAVTARYGKATLALFAYPTMEMARDRVTHFQEIAGAVAKRAGPLVVVVKAPNADDAERLLAKVKYQADVTLPEHVPTPKDNPANLFLNVIILCAILAAFFVVSGVVVGGLLILFRRSGASGDGDAMISLHLTGRQ